MNFNNQLMTSKRERMKKGWAMVLSAIENVKCKALTPCLLVLVLFGGEAFGAEIVLKIGPGSSYMDGDIVCAFSDHRIQLVHAEMICHPWKADLSKDKLRPDDSLARFWMETVKEYRFERISKNEIRRVNMRGGESKVFSEVPDPETGEHIYVDLYIQRRKEHIKPILFGKPGSEVWFGGTRRISSEKLDTIWAEIEKKTDFKRADHTYWPLGRLDKKHFVALKVEQMSNELANLLVTPLHAPGNDVMGEGKLIFKRRFLVDYETLFPNDPQIVNDFRNMDKSVDIRREFEFKLEDIVLAKDIEGQEPSLKIMYPEEKYPVYRSSDSQRFAEQVFIPKEWQIDESTPDMKFLMEAN